MTDASGYDVAGASRLVDRDITGAIIGGFYDVYNGLGFGFLESIYCAALTITLRAAGLRVDREHPVRVTFRDHAVGLLRLDMLVERRIIVEIKSSEVLPPVASRQLQNYLAASRLGVGLLLHFGPKPAFTRLVSRAPSL